MRSYLRRFLILRNDKTGGTNQSQNRKATFTVAFHV